MTVNRRWSRDWNLRNHYDSYAANLLSGDTIITSAQLIGVGPADGEWPPLWPGSAINEIDPSRNGIEFYYSYGDSLYVRSASTLNRNWAISMSAEKVENDTYKSAMFGNQQFIVILRIIPQREYLLINGANGNIRATIRENGIGISGIADIDNDGNDEILSIQNNSLKIYGLQEATAIDGKGIVPTKFSLSQNYPNPFNAQTTISYYLPSESEVTIDIFDILGRKIETLVTGSLPAGQHSIIWNADKASSGMYFYRIETGSYSDTKRCLLLK